MRILVSTVAGALCLAAFSVGQVSAAPSQTPGATDKTERIVGEEKFSPDEFFTVTYRFAPRRIRVRQGGTITWDNQTNDGHSVSVVTREQLPRTVQDVNNCNVCNDLLAAHFPNGFPPQGAPVLVLDDFKATTAPARFDSLGDSVIVAPPGVPGPTRVSVVISAAPGSTLDYLCAIHPWMQGRIQVVARGDNTDD
jgi:plastocyanin